MARSIWKGAISFGLVHIPISLQSATSSSGIDFDWLDSRTMDPVGYKRINKTTGKEIEKEHIVKGIEYEKGRYIVLSEDEIALAHPKSTQTIDIFSFVEITSIPLAYIETPYYLAPDKRGEKVYALLRETLAATQKIGLAYVILHTKQHLAAVMPIENALVLILLRWPSEVRDLATLELTQAATNATLSSTEKQMAKRLVEDMTTQWKPDDYEDTFQAKIMALVDKKAAQGKIENVETDDTSPRKNADVIDLTELLKRSLGAGKKPQKSISTAIVATIDKRKKAKNASKTDKKVTAKKDSEKTPTAVKTSKKSQGKK
ncbi:MAG TPA: Ku protein [Cellvibrionaceae bacterium]